MKFLISIIIISTYQNQCFGSPNIVDFEDVARNYVASVAKEKDRQVSWWDLYGKHPHLAARPQYKKYKISVSTGPVDYGVSSKIVDRPGYVYSQWFHNSQSNQPIQSHLSKTVERTTLFTWSLKEGIKIGAGITVNVGIPAAFGASMATRTDLPFDASQSQTKTEIETFSVANTIMVSPNTSVKAEWTVIEREMEIPWEADVYIDGNFAIWFDEKVDGSWLVFHPILLLADNKFQRWGSGLRYRVKGVFTGVRGLNSTLRTHEYQYPLGEHI